VRENDDYLRPWASDMLRAGAVDNRGNPSERALAKIAGVSNATVSRTLRGLNTPSAPTVQKIADALEVDPTEVWRRLGSGSAQEDPYDPPAESAFLSHRERRLVTEMIRVLVEGRHDRPADRTQQDPDDPTVEGPAQPDGPMSGPSLTLLSDDVSAEELEGLPFAADEEKPGDDPGEDDH